MLREFIAHADIPLPAEFLQSTHSVSVHANPTSLAVADLVPFEPSREGVGLNAVQISLSKMAGGSWFVSATHVAASRGLYSRPFQSSGLAEGSTNSICWSSMYV